MPIQTPTIDNRTYHEIVEQTQDLLQQYADWRPRPAGQPDVGQALVDIFAHMVEQVIECLNQAPERNFQAFLELVGARQLPPHPAHAPLTFYLTEGVQEMAVTVPAGTQAAPATDPSVIFETDDDLTVHRAQLQSLFVYEPAADRYADYSPRLPREGANAFPAFVGKALVEHSLFLTCEPFLTLPEPKTVTLLFETEEAEQWDSLPLVWSCGEDEANTLLAPKFTALSTQKFSLEFADLPVPTVRKVDDVEAAWLCARLTQPIQEIGASRLHPITKISAGMTLAHDEPTAKLIAFADTQRIDLSKEFYPFGEKPRRGAIFYIAVPVAFEHGESTATLKIVLHDLAPAKSSSGRQIKIAWEAWSDDRWVPITIREEQLAIANFTQGGTLTLPLPDPMTKRVVNGENGYWLRVRIIAGDYGREATYTIVIDDGKVVKYEAIPASFAPPVVDSCALTYTYQAVDLPVMWKTRNNFKFADPPTATSDNSQAFTPFMSDAEINPALYLGFDEPLPNRAVSLYWNVAPQVVELAAFKPPTLEWQYACSGKERWKKLHLLGDETRNFTRRGLITFIGPPDLQKRDEFDKNLCWLRVICKADSLFAMPEVVRVLTNTVWASQTRVIESEILGSGTGEADQILAMTKTPVLEHPQIEVRELAMPNADELKTLQREEGDDTTQHTESGEVWVRWHEVSDFYGSDPYSRHYRCDHITGEILFGDGRYGMTPPRGRNNVRAQRYHTGGGKQGNQPTHAITQLKTTIPFVDRVINYESAEGGTDAEPLDGVKLRGPKLLRHRDRAVTLADFEDLAYEASPAVARAYAIAESKGNVTLVIVARSEEAKPAPTLALCEDVAAYLRQRCAPAVQLQVCGPDWVEVAVTVAVVPASAQAANTLAATVQSALQRFLHPITGGLDQQGWTFGRQPHESDLYALIEAIDGVDHVSHLGMNPRAEECKVSVRSMIYSGEHAVTVDSTA